MAGQGNRLTPLTVSLPKALLPIANKPMLSYQLKWLEDAHINDIIVACYPDDEKPIQDYIDKIYEVALGKNIRARQVPESCGTADALRHLAPFIKTDIIVMSCDLITDVPSHYLLNAFRLASPTMVAAFYDESKLESTAEKVPSKDRDIHEFIAIDDQTSRLLLMTTKGDVGDVLNLKTPLLRKFGKVRLHSDLRDAHLYIFHRWIVDYLVKAPEIQYIKADLIPLLLEAQYRPGVVRRENLEQFIIPRDPMDPISLSTTGDRFDPAIFCSAIVIPSGTTGRADTIWSYAELNRTMMKLSTELKVSVTSEISLKTQMGPDSMVGDSTFIDERCSIKKSVIGNHVHIGRNVKIVSSIIMDHVEIGDG